MYTQRPNNAIAHFVIEWWEKCVCVIFFLLVFISIWKNIYVHSLGWLSEILKFHSSENWEMVNGNWLLLNVQFHFRTFDYIIITSGADGLAAIYLIYSLGLVSSLRSMYLKRNSSTHKNNHNSNRLHLWIPIVDLVHVVCYFVCVYRRAFDIGSASWIFRADDLIY